MLHWSFHSRLGDIFVALVTVCDFAVGNKIERLRSTVCQVDFFKLYSQFVNGYEAALKLLAFKEVRRRSSFEKLAETRRAANVARVQGGRDECRLRSTNESERFAFVVDHADSATTALLSSDRRLRVETAR